MNPKLTIVTPQNVLWKLILPPTLVWLPPDSIVCPVAFSDLRGGLYTFAVVLRVPSQQYSAKHCSHWLPIAMPTRSFARCRTAQARHIGHVVLFPCDFYQKCRRWQYHSGCAILHELVNLSVIELKYKCRIVGICCPTSMWEIYDEWWDARKWCVIAGITSKKCRARVESQIHKSTLNHGRGRYIRLLVRNIREDDVAGVIKPGFLVSHHHWSPVRPIILCIRARVDCKNNVHISFFLKQWPQGNILKIFALKSVPFISLLPHRQGSDSGRRRRY